MGLDLNLAEDFPSDDVGEGFDNIGDVLSLPPLLLEKYVQAAETAAAAAIVLDAADRRTQRREREQLKPFGSARLANYGVYSISSSGGVAGEFDFPRDGQYRIRIDAGAQQAGSEVARMLVRMGDRDLETREVPAPHDRLDTYEIDVRVPKRGKQRISAAFINDFYDPKAKDPRQRDRNLYVESIEVVGPNDVRTDDLPESHRRIFVTTPDAAGSADKAARKILESFATRAFRRPVTADELERLVDLASAAEARGESFERSIQIAVTAVLVSPHFLFRVELDPHPEDPQQVRRLNDFELATRLSYFLWSTMPDAELFELAASGKLQRQDVLRQQVQRMLQDPKAEALVENFAAQWLNLRTLDEITPDPESFGSFDEPLREAMRRETEMLFETVMRQDRSIVEFLTADYTFLNERLARHYGIRVCEGIVFVEFALSDGPSRRPAHASQYPHVDIQPDADFARETRQVDPRERAGNAPAGTAGERPAAGDDAGGVAERDRPRAAGDASRESRMCVLPLADG